jgi:hypothetical protein
MGMMCMEPLRQKERQPQAATGAIRMEQGYPGVTPRFIFFAAPAARVELLNLHSAAEFGAIRLVKSGGIGPVSCCSASKGEGSNRRKALKSLSPDYWNPSDIPGASIFRFRYSADFSWRGWRNYGPF